MTLIDRAGSLEFSSGVPVSSPSHPILQNYSHSTNNPQMQSCIFLGNFHRTKLLKCHPPLRRLNSIFLNDIITRYTNSNGTVLLNAI